jgi:hypothetical protein
VQRGDLVKHKRFNIYYLVTKVDNSEMIEVISPKSGEIRYIAAGWLELVNENR